MAIGIHFRLAKGDPEIPSGFGSCSEQGRCNGAMHTPCVLGEHMGRCGGASTFDYKVLWSVYISVHLSDLVCTRLLSGDAVHWMMLDTRAVDEPSFICSRYLDSVVFVRNVERMKGQAATPGSFVLTASRLMA